MDKAERDALAAKAEAYLKSFPNPEAAAEQFGTTVEKVQAWIKFKRYPQSVFVAMQEPPPAPETTEAAPPVDQVMDVDAMLLDLHQRVQHLEGVIELLSEQQDGVQAQIAEMVGVLYGEQTSNGGGNNLARPGAATRAVPPRGPRTAENSVVVGSRIVSRGAVGDGIAPTRDEANGSMSAGRGKLAGPAEQRQPIKPGEPGWNGPDPRTGAGGWNTPKQKLMMVPASSWPVSR